MVKPDSEYDSASSIQDKLSPVNYRDSIFKHAFIARSTSGSIWLKQEGKFQIYSPCLKSYGMQA